MSFRELSSARGNALQLFLPVRNRTEWTSTSRSAPRSTFALDAARAFVPVNAVPNSRGAASLRFSEFVIEPARAGPHEVRRRIEVPTEVVDLQLRQIQLLADPLLDELARTRECVLMTYFTGSAVTVLVSARTWSQFASNMLSTRMTPSLVIRTATVGPGLGRRIA
jgi:hypothetical protein